MPSLTRSPAYYFGLAAFFAALLVLGLLGASPGFTATDRYLPHGFCYAWQRSEFVIRLPRVQPPPAVQYAGGPGLSRAQCGSCAS